MRKYLILLLVLFFHFVPAFCLELDTSVDAEIRKKYDSNKLNEAILPALPKVAPSESKQSDSLQSYTPIEKHAVLDFISSEASLKIPAGTKFRVKSNCKIADWLKKGTQVSFTVLENTIKKDFVVPSGSLLIGEVVKSHSPQYSGNGGLIVIKITEIKLNGKYYAANGKITKADGKKVFFNKIKGKRLYISGVSKQIDKGENFYKKSRKMSSKLSNNPIGIIISPVPTIIGVAGYAATTVASPITGISQKGKNAAYSANTIFEVKLLDNVYIK